jgi:hypothetical protein
LKDYKRKRIKEERTLIWGATTIWEKKRSQGIHARGEKEKGMNMKTEKKNNTY